MPKRGFNFVNILDKLTQCTITIFNNILLQYCGINSELQSDRIVFRISDEDCNFTDAHKNPKMDT